MTWTNSLRPWGQMRWTEPFPEEEIAERLMAQRLPIAEALLDQSVVAGIGNIAKSETLVLGGHRSEGEGVGVGRR